MKLSTARRLVCMSYFTVDGLRPLLATATRIVCSGDTKRFLFPDGSVLESNKGNWKVVGMEKNPKLEAAVKRFGGFAQGGYITGNGGYTGSPKDEVVGVVRESGQVLFKGTIDPSKVMFHGTPEQREEWLRAESCKSLDRYVSQLHADTTPEQRDFMDAAEAYRLAQEVQALQELCNEKDEQLDKANRPMVVRFDWWAVALVAVVLVAHYVFKVL